MSRAILAVVATWLLISPAFPQERTVPFHTVNGVILLDGQLNGKAAAFLLDTGANNSVADYRAAGFDGKANDEPAVPVAQEPKPAIRVPHFNPKAFIAEVSLARCGQNCRCHHYAPGP